MKSFTIGKNDANQRVDKFIKKTVPNLPDSLMYKYIRLKRIKLNGKRCEISTRLKEGDKVDMYINDEFFEQRFDRYDFMHASTNLTVIYEDENIMLLDKKSRTSFAPRRARIQRHSSDQDKALSLRKGRI